MTSSFRTLKTSSKTEPDFQLTFAVPNYWDLPLCRSYAKTIGG
jgi:hypothetical protein